MGATRPAHLATEDIKLDRADEGKGVARGSCRVMLLEMSRSLRCSRLFLMSVLHLH